MIKYYLVGGAIRDTLLGLPVKDRDWVVVGATTEDMLQQGFLQYKNKFPIFIHPQNKEEYALARKETKLGTGYNGFKFDTRPSISLEEDLARRDLTINAIAMDECGNYIDPYNGRQDLATKKLRHVSLQFIEDPARTLRISRFLSRYLHLGFNISDDTQLLMKQVVECGAICELKPELLWRETEKALLEKSPHAYFNSLASCGALNKLFPDYKITPETWIALEQAAKHSNLGTVRFAIFAYQTLMGSDKLTKEDADKFCAKFNTPKIYRQLLGLIVKYQKDLLAQNQTGLLYDLFAELNVFNNSLCSDLPLFKAFCQCCEILDKRFHLEKFTVVLTAAKNVSSSELKTAGFFGPTLREKLISLRKEAIDSALQQQSEAIISNDFKKR